MQTITNFFQKNLSFLCIIDNYSVPLHLQTRVYKLMGHKISHSGVIESFGDGCVHVRIVQTSACAACKVAGHCHAAESKEKLVDVYCDPVARQLQVGQTVIVSASTQVAAHALLLGFGLPFIVLVAVLIIVLVLTGNEGLAAVSCLLALVPYYAVLYLCRGRIRDKLSFSIE